MGTEFVTLDFETTGLNSRVDRVIEIGAVRTSADGSVLREFNTLVNPNRDLGRTDIHGIFAGQLIEAPSFSEIAVSLAEVLNGAVLVGHNAKFDARFLSSELTRLGCAFRPFDPLCTLELMYLGFPRGPRRLADCCESLGMTMGQAHAALDDARMASQLLHFLIARIPIAYLPEVVEIGHVHSIQKKTLPRQMAQDPRATERDYLTSCISRMETGGDIGLRSAVAVSQYLNLLDRVLEDRRITVDEAESLVEFAQELGLGREHVEALHTSYVARLCEVIRRDGVVTDLEHSDLEKVADLLNVADWRELLDGNKAGDTSVGVGGLRSGMSVCLTGEMSVPRTDLVQRCKELELEVKTSVSKNLDVLVVADSDSMSTKARKARELGTRMVSEAVFLQLLNELG